MGFSPIPFDVLSTWSRFNPLVSWFAMLSFDFTKSIEITPVEVNCLTILYRRRMCLDLPLYITFCALPIVAWLSQYMHIVGTVFGHSRISSKKFHSHSVSSPDLSRATNSDSMVDLVIIVCLGDFHGITHPLKVKTYPLVPLVYWISDIQLAFENPSNTAGSLE